MTAIYSESTSGSLSPQDDRRAIQDLLASWIAAVKAKDVGTLTDMVTDDAVFLPPGFPTVRGKQAVEAMYKRFFPQFSNVEQTSVVEELEVAGDWAFVWGSESLVLVPQTGGARIEMQGKGMSILKRQPDGSWKIARGINNTALGSRPQSGTKD
jgi:uncharacterized protein (TIGR02246 family)